MAGTGGLLDYVEQHWPMLSIIAGSIVSMVGLGARQKQRLDKVYDAIPPAVHHGETTLQTGEDLSKSNRRLSDQHQASHNELKASISEVHTRVDDIYKLLIKED